MLDSDPNRVKTELSFSAKVLLRPPRAASGRRYWQWVQASAGPAASLAALAELRRRWLAGPAPDDDLSAARRLAAEDLGALLDALPDIAPRIAAWSDPEAALRRARDHMLATLARLGIEVEPPDLHLVERLPPPYDHPSLAVISIDASDAAQFGLAPGVYLDRRRLVPFASESALGHVLIHVALGQRSPELLGRGLEEGVAEVLGALYCGGEAVGAAEVDASFRALRYTAAMNPYREAFLTQVRVAAFLHRQYGRDGLVALVRGGRPAIKQAEGALASGRPEDVALPRAEPAAGLAARLDRLLLARGRPLAVGALAFYLARGLRAGRSVDAVADDLGMPREAARRAARELMERVFVLVVGSGGEILVDDLDLVLASGALRYELPT